VRISVVIPTSDRPDHLDRCLGSLSQVSFPDWQVVVVDQSTNNLSEAVMARWAAHLPAAIWGHLSIKNASLARNEGVRLSDGDVIAHLDDDCAVSPAWLQDVAAVFERHPDADMLLGSVRDAVGNPDLMVPSRLFTEERVCSPGVGIDKLHVMSASMYVRRDFSEDSGGFDLMLGPGSRFRQCQDFDLVYRLLAAGRKLIETPAVQVDHHGGRSWRDGSAKRLYRNYHFGEGAVHSKMIRCRPGLGIRVTSMGFLRRLMAIRPFNLITRRGPSYGAQLPMFVRGFLAALACRVDRNRMLFMSSSGDSAAIALIRVLPVDSLDLGQNPAH
jgi:GT2 family glycosyltransferase